MTTPEGQVKTSEAILTELINSAGNDRRRDTLARLKEACDVVAANGSFKLVDIERAVTRKHGPKAGPRAQSISNERKLPLGMYHYVEARDRERLATAPVTMRQTSKSGDAVLRAIESPGLDMDARSVLRDFHDRHVLTIKALERAKALLKTVQPSISVEALLSGNPQSQVKKRADVSPEYVDALARCVSILQDSEALNAVGLANDQGRIRRKGGTHDELLPPLITNNLIALLEQLKS